MPNSDCDRNLLFGILALHNGFISRDAMIRAMSVWVADKQTPLSQILVRNADLSPAHHFLMEALVKAHLNQHNDDPALSLAAIDTPALISVLIDQIDDPDVIASLAPHSSAAAAGSVVAGDARGVGAVTSAGQRFQVIRFQARGGLGEVFLAHDQELNREVALKLIKEQFCTDHDSQARFMAEAEITGGLEHPGVVPVYGLGRDARRGPYYAMRFIKGESLKDAIASFHSADVAGRDPGIRSLELRKLLGQLVDVCEAIAYAHSRGVVHRDIKPANVMLGKYGETLVVDWGLAKVVGRNETTKIDADEQTLRPSSGSGGRHTLPGSALGTPAYMSPEQAAGDLDRVGPASDIYSLGATLYTILTGRSPVADKKVEDMLLAVRLGDFPEPRMLHPGVDRLLEAVCLKAMARHPDERYPTAQALATDIEHWLADEPVAAWREPPLHRARRWARHHRVAVTGAVAALVVALIAAISVAGLMAAAARHERFLAGNERAAKALAQARLGQIEKANDLLGSVFQTLDPRAEEQEGRPLRAILGDRLKQAALSLQGETIGDPLTVAKLQGILGVSQMNLGNPDEAVILLTQAWQTRAAQLGPNHQDTLHSRNDLAGAHLAAGQTAEAIKMHEENLKARAATLGPDHIDTLDSGNELAAAYWSAGRVDEAIKLHEATLKTREATLSPDHTDIFSSRNNLAAAYQTAGRNIDAIKLYEAAIKGLESKLGRDHADVLTIRNNLAFAYNAAGRTDEAIKLHEATVKAREMTLGADHPLTLASRDNLAVAYGTAGRLDEAITLLQPTLKALESKLGLDHPDTLITMGNLADTYELAGQFAKQEPLTREGLQRALRRFGPADPQTAQWKVRVAYALVQMEKWAEAEPLMRELVSKRDAVEPESWTTFNARSMLGSTLLGQGRYAEAEPLIVSGYEGIKARETMIPAVFRTLRLSEAAERVVRLYDAWGKPGLAAQWKTKLGPPELPANVFAGP